MQIKSTIILSAFLLTTIPTICSAALSIGTDAAGTKIVAESTSTLPDFEFQPSTNVTIVGTSTTSNFSIAAWHESSIGTTKGEAYGMASDVSGVYTIALLEYEDTDGVAATVGSDGEAADFGSPWEEPLGASDGS